MMILLRPGLRERSSNGKPIFLMVMSERLDGFRGAAPLTDCASAQRVLKIQRSCLVSFWMDCIYKNHHHQTIVNFFTLRLDTVLCRQQEQQTNHQYTISWEERFRWGHPPFRNEKSSCRKKTKKNARNGNANNKYWKRLASWFHPSLWPTNTGILHSRLVSGNVFFVNHHRRQ